MIRKTTRPKTTYLVWCPDLGDAEEDAQHQAAHDAEFAADEWAEECDNEGDYPFIKAGEKGRGLVVHVRAPDGTVTRRKVSAEMVTTYTSEEVE